MVRASTAAEIYDVSPDYLLEQPVDVLPRVKKGPRLTLFALADLDAFFLKDLVGG